MFGHPAEDLIWAPDPRDDLAFTMFAVDNEREDLKQEMVEYIQNTNHYYCEFSDMINELRILFVEAKYMFNLSDWQDVFNRQLM